MNKKKQNILREIFSGANGKLSAKRVLGGVAMTVALLCTSWLVYKDGSNDVVENLLMTIFITSVSLLGLPAVTGVWNNSKINVEKGSYRVEEEFISDQKESQPDDQSCDKYDNCKLKSESNENKNNE